MQSNYNNQSNNVNSYAKFLNKGIILVKDCWLHFNKC